MPSLLDISRRIPAVKSTQQITQALQYGHARSIARAAIEAFGAGEIDSVYLVYNEFRSVISQRIVLERLLPIPRLDTRRLENPPAAGGFGEAGAGTQVPTIDYLYEPTPEELFTTL